MILSTNIFKGSRLETISNTQFTTTGRNTKSKNRRGIFLSNGQNLTIARTLTGYAFSFYIKKYGDTIVLKDGSTTIVSINSGAIVATGSNKILIDNTTTNLLYNDKWHHVYIEYNAGKAFATNIKFEPSINLVVGDLRIFSAVKTVDEIEEEYLYCLSRVIADKPTRLKPNYSNLKYNKDNIIADFDFNDSIISNTIASKNNPTGVTITPYLLDNTPNSKATMRGVRSVMKVNGIDARQLIRDSNFSGHIIYDLKQMSTANSLDLLSFGSLAGGSGYGWSVLYGSGAIQSERYSTTREIKVFTPNLPQVLSKICVSFSMNADILTIYVNGVKATSTYTTDHLFSSMTSTILYIGNYNENFTTGCGNVRHHRFILKNSAMSDAEMLAFYNDNQRVTMHEDFSNYAVGDIYGEPYLTTARPTVSELTTDQHGYPIGKKYLASTIGNYNGCTKQPNRFGTHEVSLVVTSNNGALIYAFIQNVRNAGQNPANGYYLLFRQDTTKCIELYRGSAPSSQVLLFRSLANVITINTLMNIKIICGILGTFTVYLNDILLVASAGSNPTISDLTFTTSEYLRVNTDGIKYYEIKHTTI